jgi:aminoglycoside/choline kinase family phosphotransferase
VNLHHHPQPIFLYLRDRALADGLRIHMSYEPDILGTGGALRRAAWFLGRDPSWLVNTDIAVSLDPAPILRAYERRRALAALWVTASGGPRTVDVEDGRVRCFRSERPGTAGTFTFCGLHLVSPEVLDFLPPAASCSVVDAYAAAIAAGRTVAAVDPPGTAWDDIGTPERYLAAHAAFAPRMPPPRTQRSTVRGLRSRGVRVGGSVTLSPDLSAGRGASIAGAVLLDGVRLDAGAQVRNAIVGPGVRLAGRVTGLVVRADRAGEGDVLPPLLNRMRWPIERAAVQVLPARGSDRRFLRLMCGPRRAMVAVYGGQRPENRRYAGHARVLRRLGVDVPAPLLDAPDLKATAFEDLGDASLESLYPGMSRRQRRACYRRILGMALRMHTVPPRTAAALRMEPPFSPTLYRWEHELFDTHVLARRTDLDDAIRQAILRELSAMAGRLEGAPCGIVHRDLQSSNVLIKGGRCALIDFQGMRWGPAAYDVASLLCDPYVMLPEEEQLGLLDDYCRRHPRGAAVHTSFWPAAVQRLAQALGAYGRLGAMAGTERFRRYTPQAMRMLHRALRHAGGAPRLEELAAAGGGAGGPAPAHAGALAPAVRTCC